MGFEGPLRRLALARDDTVARVLTAALVSTAAGGLTRLAIQGWLSGEVAFITFFPAVAFAAVWAGARAGVITILLSILCAWWLGPQHGLTTDRGRDVVAGAVFFLSAGVIVLLASAFRSVLRELDRTLAAERNAVAELEGGQQRLRLAHEAGALGTWEWDIATDRLSLSEGYLRNWRMPAAPGVTFLEQAAKVHPDDHAGLMESRRRTLEEGLPYRSEYRVVGEDGQVRWFASRGEPVRDADGRIVQVHGVNRDITEQKLAEDRLRESEARFRLIADSAPVMLWMDGEDGADGREDDYLNRMFRDFLGFESGSGQAWLDAVHPADRPTIEAALDAGARGSEPFEVEVRMKRADGAWRLVHAIVMPRSDIGGAARGVIAVGTDVTEARAAERALRESEARFRTMANSAPSPVWVTRAEGGVEFVNEAFCEFFGMAPEDLLGDAWVELMHPDDRGPIAALSARERAKHLPYEFQARFRRPDGEYRWVHALCRPRPSPDGAFMGYVGIAFDITVIRSAEAALRESEERFRLIAESAPVNLWMGDADGACAYLNRAQREFWGVGEDYLRSFTWADSLHPDDAPALFETLAEAMAERKPFTAEARYRRHDGQWRWLQTQAHPRLDPDGAFLGMIGVNVDVTDSRIAEEALRESEARFRAMANSAPAPIWVSGPDGGIDFGNEAILEFFGGRADHVMDEGWLSRLHPEDIDRAVVARDEGRRNNAPFSFEARFLNGRDEWRWMRCSTRPRFDGNGALLGYVGIAFDVTETHEAQEYLRQQERRQRFLLQLGDGLRETDDPHAIASVAERALGQYLRVGRTGYGEIDEETGTISVGESWTDGVLSPISGVYTLESYGPRLIADLRRGRTVRVDDTTTDPRTADVLDAFQAEGVRARLSVPVVRAGQTRAVFFLHDTRPRAWTDEEAALAEETATRTWTEIERARALIEMRESEERFRSIANSAPILVWVTNADRKRAFVNQTYVEFMGGTYEDGLNRDWREYLHPDDWERILQEQVAGEGSLKPFSLEARYRRHDGEWRWLRSFSRPRFSPTGEMLGFVGAAYDVTEERQVQADLEHINDLLAERVSQALAEKELAEAALIRAQKLEALGRLTGGVAHDFNNLLTVVVGALDMILKHPDDSAKRKRMAEAAMAAARRGEQLTHQLLAFSRRQALRPALCDVNALLGESEPLMRRAVGEAVEFEARLCEGEAVVKVDPAQFEAAVFNLLVNARDATPDGGRITVETAWRDLEAGEVSDVPAGRHVSVRITDSGQGMSADVLARVFEPFFTTKPQGKGTGLGLSQVYGFAQQSGGGIAIESEPGAGTSVTIFLPACAEALPAATVGAPASEAMSALNILLVEDDGEVAAIAETMLSHLGHQVTRVSSAARALARLRSDPSYELLLTDVVMPGGMDGVELAHRAIEMRPDLKVLLTSGYAGEAVDETLVHAPWPFLRKPYSQAELVELLTEAMAAGVPQAPQRV